MSAAAPFVTASDLARRVNRSRQWVYRLARKLDFQPHYVDVSNQPYLVRVFLSAEAEEIEKRLPSKTP